MTQRNQITVRQALFAAISATVLLFRAARCDAQDETPAQFQARADARLDDLKSRLNVPPADELWAFKPGPPQPHPRLYFGKLAKADLIRRAADPRYAKAVEAVRVFAKKQAEKPLPVIDPTKEDPNRGYVDGLAWMALAYTIEPEPATKQVYFDGLIRWTHAICDAGPYPMNSTLAQGIIGLSTVYDWLHDDLPPADQKRVRDKIISMVRYSKDINNRSLWFCKFMFNANHNWMQYGAHVFAALALQGDEDQTDLKPGELKQWLDDAIIDYYIVDQSHPADGAPSEGPGYQDYGLRTLVDVAAVTDDLLVMKHSLFSGHLKQLSNRVYMLLPGDSGYMVYADGHPTKWFGMASWWRKLADKFNDPKAEFVADVTETMAKKPGQEGWRDLFFYNPDIKPLDHSALTLEHDFTDLGVFTARKDWSDRSTFFGLRCGTYGGLTPMKNFGSDQSQGHNYPNQGEVIFYSGRDAVLPGREYAPLKLTEMHHVVSFEGRGAEAGKLLSQVGGGAAWFYNAKAQRPAQVLDVKHTPTYHQYLCDLGGVYLLKDDRVPGGQFYPQYLRSVIYAPDGAVVIVDRIKTPVPRTMQFRLLTQTKDLAGSTRNFQFTVGGKPGFITNFTDSSIPAKVEPVILDAPFKEKYPRDAFILTATDTPSAVFAVVIGVDPSLKRLSVRADETGYTLTGLTNGPLRVEWPTLP